MNWQPWQQQFARAQARVHLNHAGVSPISERVVAAVTGYISDAAVCEPSTMQRWEMRSEQARRSFARLVGATAAEVAFVKNTSEGLSLVAAGLDWSAGDNIIVADGEYPSNVYPWWSLRRCGVETRMVETRHGVLDVDSLTANADARTRLVAASLVDWNGGARADLAAIGQWCREHGVLFCVDGIQGVGAVPVDVEAAGIDFLAVGGHKWLLGPEGCGCLYVSRRVEDRLRSMLFGWKTVTDSDTYLPYHFDLRRDASKLESGTMPVLGMVALGAAIDLILEIGVATIHARILALHDRLAERARSAGIEILSPWAPELRSGIVIVRRPGHDPKLDHGRLQQAGFVLRPRGGGIRVAPHFPTRDEDIDRFVAVLASAS